MTTINRIKDILVDNNLSISVAESCTGGNLQSLLTSINGSSNFFDGGITAYTIDQKCKHLNVIREVAEPVDCVSMEVSTQMAFGVSKMFETNISISTTGYIDKYLYYCIVINNEVVLCEEMILDSSLSRRETQIKASLDILKILESVLKTKYSPDLM